MHAWGHAWPGGMHAGGVHGWGVCWGHACLGSLYAGGHVWPGGVSLGAHVCHGGMHAQMHVCHGGMCGMHAPCLILRDMVSQCMGGMHPTGMHSSCNPNVCSIPGCY